MPVSSLALSFGTVFLSVLAIRTSAQTYSYTLQDTYAGSSFYDNFNFLEYANGDPTHGFVQYVNQSVASANGLTGFGQGTAKWGVDTTNVISNTSEGRLSIRLEGKVNYNHGLFLADIKHMPGSICGVWPAFWTLGDGTWPSHGEMDIIEGVNLAQSNQYTAHTGDNCTMSFPSQSGPVYSTDCALSTGGTAGCAVGSAQANDYGTKFNSNGGGVYAMQWTSGFIKIWFFPRGSIPSSITTGSPDISTFGTPTANFDGASCDIDSHFINHRIVFDTTFCGDWAGSVYSSSSCPMAASGSNGCVNYVANNPSAFTEAYWEVNSIKVFSESVSSSSSSASSSTLASSTTSGSSSPTTSPSTSSLLTTPSSSPTLSSSSSSSTLMSSTVTSPSSSATSTTTSASSSSSTSTISALSSTSKSSTINSSSTSVASSVASTKSSSSTTNTVSSTATTTSSRSSSTTLATSSSTKAPISVTSTTSKPFTTPKTSSASTTAISSKSSIPSRVTVTSKSSSTSTKQTTTVASTTTSIRTSSSSSSSSTLKASTTSTKAPAQVVATTKKTSSTSTSTKKPTAAASTTLKTSSTTTTSATATPTTTTATCPADTAKIYVSGTKRFLIECSTDHAAGNLKTVTVTGGLAGCIKQCAATTGCVDVTLSGTSCYLKSSLGASSKSTFNGARLLS